MPCRSMYETFVPTNSRPLSIGQVQHAQHLVVHDECKYTVCVSKQKTFYQDTSTWSTATPGKDVASIHTIMIAYAHPVFQSYQHKQE